MVRIIAAALSGFFGLSSVATWGVMLASSLPEPAGQTTAHDVFVARPEPWSLLLSGALIVFALFLSRRGTGLAMIGTGAYLVSSSLVPAADAQPLVIVIRTAMAVIALLAGTYIWRRGRVEPTK